MWRIKKTPSPRFIVFYNGNEEQEDIVKYRLSNSFEIPDDSGEFEWTVKENLKNNLPLSEAVNEAVDFAINSNFLDGFFKEQRGAIMGDILTEFDQEAYDRHRRAEGIAIGEARGAHNKALEAARNALALGLSVQQTAQISSLSVEEVQELEKDLCKTPPAI